MLFTSLPWAERAQAEHDAFADALRAHGVTVLYLTGCRGGPRAMCSPVGRDPASMPDERDPAA